MMKNLKRKFNVGVVAASSAILLGLVAFSASHVSITTARADDEAAVRDALMKNALAFEKNDVAMASQVWANDDSLSVFENGRANLGWTDFRDHHLAPEMSGMKNTKYNFADMKVHLAGKTAWTTFKYSISADVVDNGQTRHVDRGGLGTAVLEERSGQWRIVHWHSSAPRRPATAPSPTP
ncbi:MAG TPA: nuclear transport factor 2 family protein [Pyrinomonadaceae bacterium]|jgi:ketosteroid isomerase-like protein|nr:nuclear transport factor 2 family protein [Pyrinomonadaceae bacterium]